MAADVQSGGLGRLSPLGSKSARQHVRSVFSGRVVVEIARPQGDGKGF